MGFITISKILMILIVPFLLFLFVLNFAVFSDSFYKEKFSEYGVNKDVPKAGLLHGKVIDFIKGGNKELPNDFNEREKQHLLDVRNVIGFSTRLLYILIILFMALLIFSAFALNAKNRIADFLGRVFVFGGLLAILSAAALLFLISSNFSSAFESFHIMLFRQGTYTFDPSSEIIVRIYPEQLFMDLGIRISKLVVIASVAIALFGSFLSFKPKSKKNKKKEK